MIRRCSLLGRVRTPAGARFTERPSVPDCEGTSRLGSQGSHEAIWTTQTNTGGSLANVWRGSIVTPARGSPKSPKRVSGD